MKIWQCCLMIGALSPLALIVTGCHGSQQQVPVTKQNFGYPGMKLGPSYYAAMAKVRAYQASHRVGGPPAAAAKPQSPPPAPTIK